MSAKSIVLMVDDDQDNYFLANEAFMACGIQLDFHYLADGIKLMDYLSEDSQSEADGPPTLILLDLNMPRKDGRQILMEIKGDPRLREIPIVIFTTSSEENDKSLTLSAGADLFITKPAAFKEWMEVMKSLADRWLG